MLDPTGIVRLCGSNPKSTMFTAPVDGVGVAHALVGVVTGVLVAVGVRVLVFVRVGEAAGVGLAGGAEAITSN